MAIQGDGNPSRRTDYETPLEFVRRVESRMGLRCAWDLCATRQTNKARGAINYFGPDHPHPERRDALSDQCDWIGVSQGGFAWLNPPYGRGIETWVAKALEFSNHGETIAGLLPGNSRDTTWWHEYCLRAHEIIDIRGRIHFLVDGIPARQSAINNVVAIWRSGNNPVMPLYAEPMGAHSPFTTSNLKRNQMDFIKGAERAVEKLHS